LVRHVGIRLSLCELASLSAFRREARRWAGQDSAERRNRKPQRKERSECERVRISGRSPALGAMAWPDYRLGQAKVFSETRSKAAWT
jgi:hypothetical protein